MLGPIKSETTTREWLLNHNVWQKLKQKKINQSQVALLYHDTKLADDQPTDAVETLESLDITLASLFLLYIVKPVHGWNENTLKSFNLMRTFKNKIYSHANKCWISDEQYQTIENKIIQSLHCIMNDQTISFECGFIEKIEDWLVKSKELINSRGKYLKSTEIYDFLYFDPRVQNKLKQLHLVLKFYFDSQYY